MKKRVALLKLMLCGFILLPEYSSAQEGKFDDNNAITFNASYIGDNVNIISGGIKTGSCYLGLANFKLSFDTENASLWKGGQFFISAANTHGASPSSEFIGDLQVVSNIEAGNHTFVQELWYKQAFGKVELTVGLQDLNVELANTENGAHFLNSSFGILPTISGNVPAPVYPLTSFGFSARWTVSEKLSLNGALFDGCPTDFESNPYNLNWQLRSNDGLLAISEMQYSTNINMLPGTYKLGTYSHKLWFDKLIVENNDSLCTQNFGYYIIADQMLWQADQRNINSFVQFGISPEKYNENYFYMGTGVNYNGLFQKNGSDVLGIAIAIAGIKGNTKNESTLELTYKTELTNYFFIQPDIQYVFNPAGYGEKLANCLEGTLRFGLFF